MHPHTARTRHDHNEEDEEKEKKAASKTKLDHTIQVQFGCNITVECVKLKWI